MRFFIRREAGKPERLDVLPERLVLLKSITAAVCGSLVGDELNPS